MDISQLWKIILAEIELSVTKATFKTHFAGSELVSLESGVATVGLVNPVLRQLVENRYYSLIKKLLDEKTQKNNSVIFTNLPKKIRSEKNSDGPLFEEISPSERPFSKESAAKRMRINPELTFESFAVSSSNQIAFAAATAIAKNPGTAYNPLFIYGGVGVGKTHLMLAIANTMLSKNPQAKIVYCMGEEFLNDIIEAIQTKSARQFKQKYRSAQLLLVDDVQFIAGKQTAQEEFFHTFNAVYREGGQIVLTSDRPPSEISRLEDRLRSRFEGGLIVDVSLPDFELRVAIINIKSQKIGLSLTSEESQLIAANTEDARAIEGILRRLATEMLAGNRTLSPDIIKKTLKGKGVAKIVAAGDPLPRRRVDPYIVLETVANHYNIKSTAIKGPKRDRQIVRPRQIIMYLCKSELGMTLEDVGGLLGGRDHTTVMHGVDFVTSNLTHNEPLRSDIEEIKRKMWG